MIAWVSFLRLNQAAAIPLLLEGRDALGKAQTGTGKTAAFSLPLLKQNPNLNQHKPQAIIMAPTRELAIKLLRKSKTLAVTSKVTQSY
ncbi:DEAD/DEAH box helicase [Vibrio chagasii]|nr:DEAD/DEAH box helicase [Vibrio chagasii]